MADLRFRDLKAGDPAPWFHQRCTSNERYAFDTVGGRYVLLCLFGSAAAAWTPARLAWVAQMRAHFDDDKLSLFGVSVDAADEAQGRVRESMPGVRHFWDSDGLVSRLFGGLPLDAHETPTAALAQLAAGHFRPLWVLLNPTLQVRAVLPFQADAAELAALSAAIATLPAVDQHAGLQTQAPIIVVPDVFDAELRQTLVQQYEQQGGEISGFMREVNGKTMGLHDPRHKVRRDFTVEDEALRALVQRRVVGRLVPVVQRVHQFKVTRMERYLVACYDAADRAHFRAHRDNTTRGTAHRRFAVTINLNDDFDGGTLSFPEYGPRRYKPPPGAALVFSCSLLHQVDLVTRGRRFAFLPFLYDDAAAAIREANLGFLADAGGLADEA